MKNKPKIVQHREELEKKLDIIYQAQTMPKETMDKILKRVSNPNTKLVIVGENKQIPNKYIGKYTK